MHDDTSLEHLSSHLKEGLIEIDPKFCASAFAYRVTPAEESLYPSLVVYRTGSEGELLNTCKATILYLYSEPVIAQYLRRAEVAIARLLRTYEWKAGSMIQILNCSQLQSSYGVNSLSLELKFWDKQQFE